MLGALCRQALLQLGQRGAQPLGPALLEPGKLGLQGRDPLGQLACAVVGGQRLLGVGQGLPAALGAVARRALLVGRALQAQPDRARPPTAPRTGGPAVPRAAGCGRRRPPRPAPAESATPASSRSASARSCCAAPALRLGLAQLQAHLARALARELEPRLQRLALQALVQLSGLGLALERAQPRARLALHVQRPRQVLPRALQLELGAPAALSVLAQARGLLDHQPPVARARVDDRLDLALGDHRVHLLAQAGVREHLDHVDQPALGPVEPVLALAVAVELAHDRDLREVDRQRAIGVVDHHLHLGAGGGRQPVAAGEDHVLHRLAAHGQRALLAQRPQHGLGHVGLARAVGPHHHRHARSELQPGAVREGLEALQGQRAQVHQPSASRAAAAASCSAAFLVLPSPRPTSRPSISATTANWRSCAGPLSSTVR